MTGFYGLYLLEYALETGRFFHLAAGKNPILNLLQAHVRINIDVLHARKIGHFAVVPHPIGHYRSPKEEQHSHQGPYPDKRFFHVNEV